MKIQGAISTELLISWIAFVIIPTLLIVIVPLIDRILTDEFIEFINNILDNVEIFIWSTNLKLLLATIWIAMITMIIRRILKFFKH